MILIPSRAAGSPATRNPERTQERILQAAFKEFAAKGFAGARVDGIARRAAINKRMLYHYFGDKEGLFREVLRRKMAERQAWGVATPDDPIESLVGAVGVQGREAQVSGFGERDCIVHRLAVTNLADENDVRRLSQGVFQRIVPGVSVDSHFAVGDE